MDVFGIRNKLITDYARYVRSFIRIRDPKIDKLVQEALEDGELWPDPLLQVSPSFEQGDTLEALVTAGELHPEALRIFAKKREDGTVEAPLRLFRHQVEGLRAARRREPYVLTTGTGSGKSLAYIVPIVDDALRTPRPGRIRAIVVYPMNALANSQEGELEKYLCRGFNEPRVRFARYTGQDDEAKRKKIAEDPPDILLTNYVMLELMLTRPREAPLVRAAEGLRFLVFDELHTYRGRQGADVALLIRRARAAFQSPDLLSVGTSATMSTKGTWLEQQAEIAGVASTIFGMPVQPSNVIGESLVRTTPELPLGPASDKALSEAVADRSTVEDLSLDALLKHPVARWLEGAVGVRREESGRLVRATPMPFGENGLVGELAQVTHCKPEWCEEALVALLGAASKTTRGDGRPLFGLRLHQFISKGDTVYASVESEAVRHVTLRAQRFVPGSDRQKVLLPLAFCRECGQEYYVVKRRYADVTTTEYEPRDLGDFSANDGQPGFLYISATAPWPTDPTTCLAKLPETWLDGDDVSSALKKRVPREVTVGAAGEENDAGIRAAFVPAPFGFCIACEVAYTTRQTRDFGKLATLGSEGRSTATTVLTLSAIRRLRGDPTVESHAQKLLTFTDNRQDASLQAGHFNDFVELVQLRSALAAAVGKAPPEGLRHDELPLRVFEALALPLSAYALNDQVRFAARTEVDSALRDSIGYRLYVDLRRGWRLTSPNLEQCGLLVVKYAELEAFCADESVWQGAHPALARELSGQRFDICQVLLDFLRRDLAIAVPFLDRAWQEGASQRSFGQLQSGWVMPVPDALEQATVVFGRSRPKQGRLSREWRFLSARGSYGQWLRKIALPSTTEKQKLGLPDTAQILGDLLARLLDGGFLVPKEPLEGTTGVQVAPHAFRFCGGSGEEAAHDPLRVPRLPEGGLRTNPSFVELYRAGPESFRSLEAREHTAQVSNERREDREDRFRSGKLPILYCSPTMELGVDIAQLDVVGLRNVPPNPANYAQRSGRAGRNGQPALIFTYCSAGSPHDQHFFREPEKMVAGVVTAPRLDIGNEDLVRAHVHALWLAASGLDLGHSMKDVLDVSGESPSLAILDRIAQELANERARDRAGEIAVEALGDALREVAGVEGHEAWLARVLREVPQRFENACARWRSLYMAAHGQQVRQNRFALDASRDPRERDAAIRLRQQAETQLRLLTEIDMRGSSDFYVYRYFASEGFLPGYAFPRLPLSAFIEGQRGKQGTEAYLSRPRFIAISEFGPRSLIYHEGNRYAVTRVALPMGPDADALAKDRAAICEVCGYLHPRSDDAGPDLCERCGQALPPVIPNLFRMQNVTTRRRDRITSDEEERQRLGFEIVTGVRFADRSDRSSAMETALVTEDGDPLAELVHGDAATIWRLNVGWRRRAKKDERGFFLDVERGIWAKRAPDKNGIEAGDEGPDEAMSKRIERVIPYVADTRNCLLVTPAGNPGAVELVTLGYALQGAIARVFQLEQRELAVELLPNVDNARTLLLYEATEGGAGVLARLAADRDELGRVVDAALELIHVDPDTGVDRGGPTRGGEPCEAACYDCLLSYFNQRLHGKIDRRAIMPMLAAWRSARFQSSATIAPRGEHVERLLRLTESDLEKKFLRFLDERGHRLPSTAQLALPDLRARADFAYEEQCVLVFVDGPHHDPPEARSKDADTDDRLADAGFTVLRFRYDEDWAPKLEASSSIFGRPASSRPPRP